MNDGQLDDLIDYLRYFQISQQEELQNIEANINSALLRIDNSSLQVESEIVRQVELIDAINLLLHNCLLSKKLSLCFWTN